MYAFFINLINALIRGLGAVLGIAFGMLPESPFQKYLLQNDMIKQYVGYINYFVPVAEMLVVLEAWCFAIGVYYIIQIVLRWLNAIE
jgi:hypothetical protein